MPFIRCTVVIMSRTKRVALLATIQWNFVNALRSVFRFSLGSLSSVPALWPGMFPDVLGVCVLVKLVITSPVVVEWSFSHRPAVQEKIAIITYPLKETISGVSLSPSLYHRSQFCYQNLNISVYSLHLKTQFSSYKSLPGLPFNPYSRVVQVYSRDAWLADFIFRETWI